MSNTIRPSAKFITSAQNKSTHYLGKLGSYILMRTVSTCQLQKSELKEIPYRGDELIHYLRILEMI